MSSKIIPLRRGDIIRVRFDPVVGHEQAGIRPALVLSPEFLNGISSVILVASITSKRLEFTSPAEAFLEAGEGGLKIDSKVMLMQTRSIDKRRILSHYGSVTPESLKRIDKAIAIATGLRPI
jgi:mRNA interferase MazF